VIFKNSKQKNIRSEVTEDHQRVNFCSRSSHGVLQSNKNLTDEFNKRHFELLSGTDGSALRTSKNQWKSFNTSSLAYLVLSASNKNSSSVLTWQIHWLVLNLVLC